MAAEIYLWRVDGERPIIDIPRVTSYLEELFGLRPDGTASLSFIKPGLNFYIDIPAANDDAQVVSIALYGNHGSFSHLPFDPIVFYAILFCIQNFDGAIELEMVATEGNTGESFVWSDAVAIGDLRDFLESRYRD